MRPGDTLARMGGDEFTAILTACDTEDDAAEYARELLAVLAPFPCERKGIICDGQPGNQHVSARRT